MITQTIEQLNLYIRGWRGYFGFCQTPGVLGKLDCWIRRRLRSVVWKQWKRGKRRFAALRSMDINKSLAARTAGSVHGPWRVSRSPALCFALSNGYFDSLGLVHLTELGTA
jgi:RNA-directed DNA polymerase